MEWRAHFSHQPPLGVTVMTECCIFWLWDGFPWDLWLQALNSNSPARRVIQILNIQILTMMVTVIEDFETFLWKSVSLSVSWCFADDGLPGLKISTLHGSSMFISPVSLVPAFAWWCHSVAFLWVKSCQIHFSSWISQLLLNVSAFSWIKRWNAQRFVAYHGIWWGWVGTLLN